MNPAALATQLNYGLSEFLKASFWSSTPGMEEVIGDLLDSPGEVFKGPYVSARLPFVRGSEAEFFPDVPLGFPAHRHQEMAWARLSGKNPKSTLVATGTGSGKTECFLYPILNRCLQHIGTPGVKAILIYPMNALATDQAGRIAKAIHHNPKLQGAVRAGLYIGESPGKGRSNHKVMGPDYVITDRRTMQLSPPDILLTNYKMLDYLLIRPGDQELWQHNGPGTLQFLVVDELHTFDGAQGTDLACLLRRLKHRLHAAEGKLCCIGTSATLGGGDAPSALRQYAEEVFGEPFDEESVIREARLTPNEFFGSNLIEFAGVPEPDDPGGFEPSRYPSPLNYVEAQRKHWFPGDPASGEPGEPTWRVGLGNALLRHGTLRNLLMLLSEGPVLFDDLVDGLSRTSQQLREDKKLASAVLTSFLSMISEARSWMPEREEARLAREEAGEPRKTRPFLEVRLQLWQRELRRMVADLSSPPSLRFSDDLTDAQRRQHLPLIHCRDCGAMGWATLVSRDRPDIFRAGLESFYRNFFGDDPRVRFLWTAEAFDREGPSSAAQHITLHREELTKVRDTDDVDPDEAIEIKYTQQTRTVDGEKLLSRDCPFCAARDSLTLVGFRAATLTSVYIDQLFASVYNDDKKLLAFSDSVQDAAHRAGFFGARTWRFNLRVALQKTLSEATEQELRISKLPKAFSERWRGNEAAGRVRYASTFIAPNMEWFSDYEELQSSGRLPEDSRLLRDIDARIAYEIYNEFGHQARIGRSLARSGSATVVFDNQKFDAATNALLRLMPDELGGFRELTQEVLRGFLLGALHRLRERGGILHEQLPPRFVESGGKDTYSFYQAKHLPSYGSRSRLPSLLTDWSGASRFDVVTGGKRANTWYDNWVVRCFGGLSPVIASSSDVWGVALPALQQHGLLHQAEAKGSRVWGISPDALIATTEVRRLSCNRCGHWMYAGESEVEEWKTVPCLTSRCDGSYEIDKDQPLDYYGHLYRSGEVERVFTAEHTGLLSRPEREEVERAFKLDKVERKPWHPNLLSCTPTLEMGIDIGSLSSAFLCSVPPAQANYLQRIGRAGRKDGNSFILTIAQAKPHDLYFYSQPEEMLNGEVQPPGVFLNAAAVLERQLAAFCFDRWNADGEGVTPDALPSLLKVVFKNLRSKAKSAHKKFPHNWLNFIQSHETEILEQFLSFFGATLTEDAQQHLRDFLRGNREEEGNLSWKVLNALWEEYNQLESLQKQSDKVQKAYDKLKEAKAQNKDHEQQLEDLELEKDALDEVVKGIENTRTLEFLTDQGLLPNYAFPESPVSLRSVIWRRSKGEKSGKKYSLRSFEYTRPAMAAISELAPENRFFAGGRKVRIDQVDVATSTLETWRFCDSCAFSERIDAEDHHRDCPACESPGWGEEGQKRPLLRLKQVFARTHDPKSRIHDEQEERQPRHYNRDVLVSFAQEDRGPAWKLDVQAVPFAFEYIRRANFRELNFGEFTDQGAEVAIAGRLEVRQGFQICRHCGKVQPNARQRRQGNLYNDKDLHTLWCPTKKRESKKDDFEVAVYLYREFASEALRLLLPLSDVANERQLNSFTAAFQLGLRDRYGGKVDHLRTLLYSEPEKGERLRRQYLVLYDTVPGGTGYLKDLIGVSHGDELHPLLEVLQRAQNRLTNCVCFPDPERDGCYRCLFAYRNSRDMSATSSEAALEVIGRILDHASLLTSVTSLSEVSVSGLMDSILEARFIDAFRRWERTSPEIRLEKFIVRNKPGYRVIIDKQTWKVELQLYLSETDGFSTPISIDFVFRAGQGETERLPATVFLDGYRYHRDRVAKDMLQRMTLIESGSYDVWSLTWHDLDLVFDPKAEQLPFLLHEDLSVLKGWLKKFKLTQWSWVFERPLFEVLVRSLAQESKSIPWDKLASVSIISQVQAPGTISVRTWLAEVKERLPEAAWPWFEEVDDSWLFVRRAPKGGGFFGFWAAMSRQAVKAGIQNPDALQEVRVLVWLDNQPEFFTDDKFRDAWNGFLHTYQFLRFLPHVWFVASHDRDEQDYTNLGILREAASKGIEGPWMELEVLTPFLPLVERLAPLGLPPPEVGEELPDEKGRSSGLEGEMVWADFKTAVVEELDEEYEALEKATGWRFFALGDLLNDVGPLLGVLEQS